MKKHVYRLVYFLVIIFCFFIMIGCDFYYNGIKTVKWDRELKEMNEVTHPTNKNRIWSILIYMAADNDLEASAIEDIYEMEVSKLNTDQVSIFILLDRSNFYDTSNENWTNTKLLKLKTGRARNCKTIISEEIPCNDLNINLDGNTEVDMSSMYTLSKAITFIKEQYPSDMLGLIMWGHGTGWRSNNNHFVGHKGFGFDDSTNSYMTLKQFRMGIESSLNNKKLDFLGLDTCFGSELEVMYELRNCVKYTVGVEGLLLLSGWNYEKIFNSFERNQEKTAERLCKICVEEFKKEYELSSSASIAAINMSRVSEYFDVFDKTMKLVADEIITKNIRDTVMSKLCITGNDNVKKYSVPKDNCDVYIDINSLFENCLTIFNGNIEIEKNIKFFKEISNEIIFENWSSDTENGGLGVFFGTLTAGKYISSVHDSAYVKGKVIEQIQFVSDSKGYVPTLNGKTSFLDKLFYSEM